MFKYIYKIKTEDLLYGIHILEYSETMNHVYVLDNVDELLTEVFVSRCKHSTYKQANTANDRSYPPPDKAALVENYKHYHSNTL